MSDDGNATDIDLLRIVADLLRILDRLTARLPVAPNAQQAAQHTAPGVQHAAPDRATEHKKTPLDLEILDLLRRGETLKGAVIARRLRRNSSSVRRRLALLVKVGLIQHQDGGYKIATSAAQP